MVDLSEDIELDKNKKHEIDVIIDRITLREGIERRLFEAVELALAKANGIIKVETKEANIYLQREVCLSRLRHQLS